jgi:uncharacterized Zn finger protein
VIGVAIARLPAVPDDLPEETIDVNCGKCGKSLTVRIQDVKDKRTIECEECGKVNRDRLALRVFRGI